MRRPYCKLRRVRYEVLEKHWERREDDPMECDREALSRKAKKRNTQHESPWHTNGQQMTHRVAAYIWSRCTFIAVLEHWEAGWRPVARAMPKVGRCELLDMSLLRARPSLQPKYPKQPTSWSPSSSSLALPWWRLPIRGRLRAEVPRLRQGRPLLACPCLLEQA